MSTVHFGNRLKEFLEKQENGVMGAAEKLGYTYSALYPIFRKEDVNTKILRLVSQNYNVPMSFFFQTENTNSINHIAEPAVEYKNNRLMVLEAEKKGLEKENQLLREMVEILKKDK